MWFRIYIFRRLSHQLKIIASFDRVTDEDLVFVSRPEGWQRLAKELNQVSHASIIKRRLRLYLYYMKHLICRSGTFAVAVIGRSDCTRHMLTRADVVSLSKGLESKLNVQT